MNHVFDNILIFFYILVNLVMLNPNPMSAKIETLSVLLETHKSKMADFVSFYDGILLILTS